MSHISFCKTINYNAVIKVHGEQEKKRISFFLEEEKGKKIPIISCEWIQLFSFFLSSFPRSAPRAKVDLLVIIQMRHPLFFFHFFSLINATHT